MLLEIRLFKELRILVFLYLISQRPKQFLLVNLLVFAIQLFSPALNKILLESNIGLHVYILSYLILSYLSLAE